MLTITLFLTTVIILSPLITAMAFAWIVTIVSTIPADAMLFFGTIITWIAIFIIVGWTIKPERNDAR